MLYLAKLYKYTDGILIAMLALCIIIVLLRISISKEEAANKKRSIKDMKIVHNISDPSVLIRGFVVMPGTDTIYVPVYGYYKDGVLHKTLSYRKCKRECMSRHGRGVR